MQVSNNGIYLRVGFINSQNLEYGDTDYKYPYIGAGVCLTKIKKLLYKNYTFI